MIQLYGDENFDVHAIQGLCNLGYDALSARDAGMANRGIQDHEVLEFATENNRAVITFDRRDYFRLHKNSSAHAGIIACTYDADSHALAQRIHLEIEKEGFDLAGKFIRIYRPNI
jgi:Domain of unknown function (DUF5615)